MKHWLVITCGVVGGTAVILALVSARVAISPAANAVEVPGVISVRPTSILFVGDIMLDRNVAVHARAAGDEALFAGVQNLFAGHDALIGNLEGAITTNSSVAQQDHSILRFTFDPRFAQVLANFGFSAVSLANNHALDFGEFGYEDTLHYLSAAQVGAFGAPFNDSHLALEVKAGDLKICLVGYHALFASDTTTVTKKIIEIRPRCDKVIVMTHWGEEYQHEPTVQQQNAGHAFIDAGADVVIGSHPHVVEPVEIYKNHAIFYSLGNFIFDQHFSPQVQRGLAVEINFTTTNTQFVLTPVNTYEEASVATGAVRDAVLQDVIGPTLSPDMTKSILQQGSFELKESAVKEI
jgi:poly-gamma-glutamate synthesis protein (capsule biosynthesis protein)